MNDIACGVHWLTFTAGHDLGQVKRTISAHVGVSRPMAIGGFGHPYKLVHGSGAQIYYGSAREDQPIVVNVEGQVCEGWADEALTWACDLGGIVTRMDLAADVPPAELAKRRLAQMRREWLRRRVKTRMDPKSHRNHGDDKTGGRTEEFGGNGSALKLRAYTERGPLRLEWQWRPHRESGMNAARVVKQMGPAAVWRGLAEAAVWPMAWYQDMLKGERAEWRSPEAEETSLEEARMALWRQWGPALWAFGELGMSIDDLASPPRPERPMRGDVVAKMLRWCDEWEAEGKDASKLRAQLLAMQAKDE